AVDFVCRLLHLKIISLKKPLQIGLCNKASIYYKDNFYNFRRIFKGPPSLKLIQLLYYITQDIKCIILDNKK
ncbi:hypothetical protein ABLU01_14720, partial [Acinetobacter pittii]